MTQGGTALAVLAAAAATESNPEDAVRGYFTAIERQGYRKRIDPLYPGVILFKEGDSFRGYVKKSRRSVAEAKREVDALNHWIKINDLRLDLPHYLPLVNFGNIVLSPFVGPEVYMLEKQISDRLIKEADTEGCDRTKEDIISLRRALVLRQLDLLARSVVAPYIPKDDKGNDIIDNRDVVTYYKKNMEEVLRSMLSLTSEKEEDLLSTCLDFLTGNFLHDTSDNTFRYVDTYSRNLCFRVTTDVPTPLLNVTLDDILRAREKKHKDHMDENLFLRDKRFLRYRLVLVDGHRNEKIALAGEMEANIIQAPRLLDCSVAPFDTAEQINALCHFFLARELEMARVKGKTSDTLYDLFKEIKMTEGGEYSFRDLENALRLEQGYREHHVAMSLYKAIRWLGYVKDEYIPRYQRARQTRLTIERLECYSRDMNIYRSVALEAIHTLMETLYKQIESSGGRKITLDIKHNKYQYVVERDENVDFICYSRNRANRRKGRRWERDPITTTNQFMSHINRLDTHARTKTEEKYAGLLKLAYIKSIIRDK